MKICFDAGHGGQDPGAVAFGLKEKDITLDLVKRVKKKVNAATKKIEIILTRDSDKTMSLAERCRIANAAQADYFISFHVNAGKGIGMESHTYTNASNATLNRNETYHKTLMGQLPFVDRGVKYSNFQVLRETKMSAILVENLFIDHRKDNEILNNEKERDKIAAAHCAAILKIADIRSHARAAASPSFTPVSLNSRGNDVKIVQSILSLYSIDVGPIDGIAGNKTIAGIKELQKNFSIAVDGVFGKDSLKHSIENTP